jgi:hypothetical protein
MQGGLLDELADSSIRQSSHAIRAGGDDARLCQTLNCATTGSIEVNRE